MFGPFLGRVGGGGKHLTFEHFEEVDPKNILTVGVLGATGVTRSRAVAGSCELDVSHPRQMGSGKYLKGWPGL